MSSLFGIGGGGNVGAAGGGGGILGSHAIDQSLRFDGSSAYLSKNDFGTATDTNIRTFSTWIKQSDVSFSDLDAIIGCAASGIQTLTYYNNNTIGFYNTQGGIAYEDNTTAKFRDVGAWFHIFFTYSHTANEMKLYINGSLTKGFSEGTHGPLEKLAETGHITTLMKRSNAGQYVSGYLAETVLLDGYVGDINDFAEEINGIWVPKNISAAGLTYGNNGFYLNYADSSDLGKDVSGQGNHFTATNLAAEDQVPDSPTNNFATINVIDSHTNSTYTEGNLNFSDGGGDAATCLSTFVIPDIADTTTYYIELLHYQGYALGIAPETFSAVPNIVTRAGILAWYSNGDLYDGSSVDTSGWSTASTTGEIRSMVVGNGQVEYFRNGTSLGVAFTGLTGAWKIASWAVGSAGTGVTFNFGQDDTFADAVTSGSAESTDANGHGKFYYSEAADHIALCSANLPEPAIGPNSDTTSDEYFDTVLWTGNGTSPGDAQEINGLLFQPDFVWVKGRSGTQWHELHDSVRGVGKRLFSNETNAETDVQSMTSFDNDGFTVAIGTAGNNGTNENGSTYVGWSWKAGGTASTIAVDAYSAGVPSTASSVSANQDAGFSILTYTADAATGTVGHGLNSAPELIIGKPRNEASTNWYVMHTPGGVVPANNILNLDSTNAAFDPGNNHFNDTYPTDTVVSYGGYMGNPLTGDDKLMYCFHSVEGFSRVGSYRGNADADGTFVFTGFRPAWVLLKDADSTSDWQMYDSKRYAFNKNNVTEVLEANQGGAETTTINELDLLSNGFKLRSTNTFSNKSSNFIYLAFAEAPFKYANAR